jgi:hypothetical protein
MSFDETKIKMNIFSIGLGNEKFYCNLRSGEFQKEFEFKNDSCFIDFLLTVERKIRELKEEHENGV